MTYGVRKIVIGCGGSAFSDGGLGAISALFNLPLTQEFKDVLKLDRMPRMKGFEDLEILIPCDVKSPLCGPNGAAFMFGR
jgi:glycerate kinase